MEVGKIGHLSHFYRNKSIYFITFLFFFKDAYSTYKPMNSEKSYRRPGTIFENYTTGQQNNTFINVKI